MASAGSAIKKNDNVVVVSGRDRGKKGRVLRVIPDKGRLIVEGVNFVKRHTRPNPQRNIKGGIAEREAPIHVSNVMIVSPEQDRRSRIGYKRLEDGSKLRIARRDGGVLEK